MKSKQKKKELSFRAGAAPLSLLSLLNKANSINQSFVHSSDAFCVFLSSPRYSPHQLGSAPTQPAVTKRKSHACPGPPPGRAIGCDDKFFDLDFFDVSDVDFDAWPLPNAPSPRRAPGHAAIARRAGEERRRRLRDAE